MDSYNELNRQTDEVDLEDTLLVLNLYTTTRSGHHDILDTIDNKQLAGNSFIGDALLGALDAMSNTADASQSSIGRSRYGGGASASHICPSRKIICFFCDRT